MPPAAAARILGIDPGLQVTGWCVLALADGRVGTRTGALRPPARASLPQRLRFLAEGLLAVIDAHQPAAVAVERPFVRSNVRAAMALGQAQAAAFLAAAQRDLPVTEYAPREVKLAIAGDGAAAKEAVAEALRLELGLDASVAATLDESDALGVAFCHYLHGLQPGGESAALGAASEGRS